MSSDLNSLTVAEWLAARRLENAENTVGGDKTSSDHFLEWSRSNSVIIPLAGQSDLDRYYEVCKATLRPNSIYHRLKMLRNLYKFLYRNHRHGYRNPTVGWKPSTEGLPVGHRGQHRPEPMPIEILTVEQVNTFLRKAEAILPGLSGKRQAVHARRIALTEMIYSFGLTPTAATTLRRSQFREYTGLTEIGGEHDRRQVPLTRAAHEAVERWFGIADAIVVVAHDDAFFSASSGAPLDTSGIAKDVVLFGNLVHPTKDPELNSTNLRNSFAAHLLVKRADPALVAHVLGNGSMDVVSRIQTAAQNLADGSVAS